MIDTLGAVKRKKTQNTSFLCMIVLPMMLLEVWKRDSLGGVIVWSGKVLKDGSPVFQSNTFSGDRLFYNSYQRQKGQIN